MTFCPNPADIQYWQKQGVWSMKQEWPYIIQSVQFIHWAFSISLQCRSQCPRQLRVQFHQFSEQIFVNLPTKQEHWACWQIEAEQHTFKVPLAMRSASVIHRHAYEIGWQLRGVLISTFIFKCCFEGNNTLGYMDAKVGYCKCKFVYASVHEPEHAPPSLHCGSVSSAVCPLPLGAVCWVEESTQ